MKRMVTDDDVPKWATNERKKDTKDTRTHTQRGKVRQTDEHVASRSLSSPLARIASPRRRVTTYDHVSCFVRHFF